MRISRFNFIGDSVVSNFATAPVVDKVACLSCEKAMNTMRVYLKALWLRHLTDAIAPVRRLKRLSRFC